VGVKVETEQSTPEGTKSLIGAVKVFGFVLSAVGTLCVLGANAMPEYSETLTRIALGPLLVAMGGTALYYFFKLAANPPKAVGRVNTAIPNFEVHISNKKEAAKK
jgi:hypothetical protein